MQRTPLRRIVLATLLTLPPLTTQALIPQTPWQTLPDVPRVSVWGLAGTASGSSSVSNGDLDALVPVIGDNQSLVFGDVQGKYGQDDGWLGSLGAGYRTITPWNNILGAYLFIDRSTIGTEGNGYGYWVASPGIEVIVPHYSARLTGYFTLSNKQPVTEQQGSATGGATTFSGHTQYSGGSLTNILYTTGNGTDGELGATIPALNNLQAYLGGYYFVLPMAPICVA